MMLDKLTQEQQWGLAYLLQLHNTQITASNEGLEQRNRFKPRSEPLEELKPLLDLEQFATLKLTEIANQGYNQLISYKEQMALQMFRALPASEQAALIEQFQIPDVLEE